jgi:hypothetical protein
MDIKFLQGGMPSVFGQVPKDSPMSANSPEIVHLPKLIPQILIISWLLQ